jgi:hypothetical protein
MNILQEDDILCELYVDRSSDVSNYSDNESRTMIMRVMSPLVYINSCDLQLLLVKLKQVQ